MRACRSWPWRRRVPAHTGGADLSSKAETKAEAAISPRPHGRGGFKFEELHMLLDAALRPRPHGRGGFKYRVQPAGRRHGAVPAHTGGADLSRTGILFEEMIRGPRPHGRGGFKL